MKILKGAFIFILGAGVGATGSYIYCKKDYTKRKEELDILKEHYMNKLSDSVDEKIAKDIIEDEGYVSYDKINEKEEVVTKKTKKKTPSKSKKKVGDKTMNPVIITEEDYSERELYFEKIEADYYLGDGALVDESDTLLVIEDTVGYENIEEFLLDESEDTIYIRNEVNNADYLIHKVAGKYSEVIGIGGDDNDD